MRGDWHGRESWDLFFLRLRRYDVWVPNANMWWVSTTISRAFLSVPPRSGSTTCSKAHRWLLPHGFLSRYVFRSGKCVQRGMRGRADTTWVRRFSWTQAWLLPSMAPSPTGRRALLRFVVVAGTVAETNMWLGSAWIPKPG